MKIAVDIRVLAEKRTGKASHLIYALQGLSRIDATNQYILYTQNPVPDNIELPKKSTIKTINGRGVLWHINCWRDAMKNEKVDTFLATTSYIIPALSKKCVIVIHDLVSFLGISKHNQKAQFIEKRTMKRAVANAQSIIAVSQSTKADLERLFPQSKNKTHVVLEAIDPIFYEPASSQKKESVREKYNLPKRYMLFVSTIEARKNIKNLLEANRSVRQKNTGEMPMLVLAGKMGWGVDDQIEELESQKANGWVMHIGHIDGADLPALYQQAEIYVFPTLYEGFGLTVLEAMASRVPVITSCTSSLPEIGGKAVIYIDPKSSQELALAMHNMIHNPTLRKQMAEKGHQQAKKFGIQKMATETYNVMQAI